MKDFTFLTVEDVLWWHERALTMYGGDDGIINESGIHGAVGAAKQTFGGELLNKSIEEVAASYWISLTNNHCFVDGNKRVAVYCVTAFLFENGKELTLSNEEVERITLDIAAGKLKKEGLVELLQRSIVEDLGQS